MPARQSAIILPAWSPVRSKATPIFAACSANSVKSCFATPDCAAAAIMAAMPSAAMGMRPAMSRIVSPIASISARDSKLTTLPTSAIADSKAMACAEASPSAPSKAPAPSASLPMDAASRPNFWPSVAVDTSTPFIAACIRRMGPDTRSAREKVAKMLKTSMSVL